MKSVIIVGSGVVSIPPKFGGAVELIIHETAKAAAKKFDVYVLDSKDGRKKEEKIGGVNYIRFDAKRFGNKFLLRITELLFGTKSLLAIRKLGKKASVGVVHAHTVFSALPLALFKHFLPDSARLVYTCHNPAWSNEKTDFLNNIIMKIEGFVMRRCDLVTTVSEFMKESICKKANISHKNLKTVYNFADSKFSPRHWKPWKKKANLNGPMVLFVSKLIANKGVEHVIRAAEIVKKTRKDVKFVMAGPVSFEYEGENKWAKLVKDLDLEDTVLFTGALSDEELPLAYSSAEIFCFPTLQESFGVVIVEAMASGLPVITSDLPVTREVAGNAAIYVKKGDYHGLANNILLLLENEPKRAKMIKASVERSLLFRKENILNGYEEIYSKFCK